MVQLVKKSGSTTLLTQTNVYNQDGIRISRTQGNSEREYYYNNGVAAYTEDNNSLSSANIQNDDGGVIGTYRGSTYYNYLKNMQGSTESIISETGTTAAVYTYSDFGETEEVVVDSIGNEICYTGAIYDKDTGLYYMNARYYDAETGRFISQDSYRGEIEDAGTWHLYAYCSNNPVNYVDPTGHVVITTTLTAGAFYSIYHVVLSIGVTAVIGETIYQVISFSKTKKAGGGKTPIHHSKGCHGNKKPHYHPNVKNNYRLTPNGVSSHDHYYYPK